MEKKAKKRISGAVMDDDEVSLKGSLSVLYYRFDGGKSSELEWPSR